MSGCDHPVEKGSARKKKPRITGALSWFGTDAYLLTEKVVVAVLVRLPEVATAESL